MRYNYRTVERKKTKTRFRNLCEANISSMLQSNYWAQILFHSTLYQTTRWGVHRIETVTGSGSLLRRACGAGDERWGVRRACGAGDERWGVRDCSDCTIFVHVQGCPKNIETDTCATN